jgi:nicotinate-nucleotide adenylyltransferase
MITKIAVFGGSFDPIHNGHISIIKKALEQLDIDKLIVVPAFLNPFKTKSHLSAKDRLEMINIVFQNTSDIIVCDFEINQHKSTTTIDTIKYIKTQYRYLKKIYFIIGADNLAHLNRWHKIDQLKQEVEFVVATRDNIATHKFKTLDVDYNISSTQLRNKLDFKHIPPQIKHLLEKNI